MVENRAFFRRSLLTLLVRIILLMLAILSLVAVWSTVSAQGQVIESTYSPGSALEQNVLKRGISTVEVSFNIEWKELKTTAKIPAGYSYQIVEGTEAQTLVRLYKNHVSDGFSVTSRNTVTETLDFGIPLHDIIAGEVVVIPTRGYRVKSVALPECDETFITVVTESVQGQRMFLPLIMR